MVGRSCVACALMRGSRSYVTGVSKGGGERPFLRRVVRGYLEVCKLSHSWSKAALSVYPRAIRPTFFDARHKNEAEMEEAQLARLKALPQPFALIWKFVSYFPWLPYNLEKTSGG